MRKGLKTKDLDEYVLVELTDKKIYTYLEESTLWKRASKSKRGQEVKFKSNRSKNEIIKVYWKSSLYFNSVIQLWKIDEDQTEVVLYGISE